MCTCSKLFSTASVQNTTPVAYAQGPSPQPPTRMRPLSSGFRDIRPTNAATRGSVHGMQGALAATQQDGGQAKAKAERGGAKKWIGPLVVLICLA